MHPTATRSNRSTPVPSPPAPSPLLNQQASLQHQQQILYSPITNQMVPIQPCATGLHPPCVYSGMQHNSAVLSTSAQHMQGKNSRWPSKSRIARSQQQHSQQLIQQQLSYNPKPVLFYDQVLSSAPAAQPTASFLVASSTFAHGSFPNDQYNASGVTLIPQAYFKPQDVQTFCLQSSQQQQQEQGSHGSYYNIAATNTCSLQTLNANSTIHLPNLSLYGSIPSQISGSVQTATSGQLFASPTNIASPVNLAFNQQKEKSSSLSTVNLSTFKPVANKVASTRNVTSPNSEGYIEWSIPATTSTNNVFDATTTVEKSNRNPAEGAIPKSGSSSSAKMIEDHYSDESTASFDFTIEAEKMVSALCNTTSSNDLEREETRNNKKDAEPLFSGAGDTVSNKTDWFSDLCTDYGIGKSVAIQTDEHSTDRSQFPELIRKAAYWGCTEAEIILNNISKTDAKSGWLKHLSSATKVAITKSSTCFPIFAGNHVFTGDLINALLRITNGWLILDNYLNKQQYPNNKFNDELTKCFYTWEEATYRVLNQIVHTFKKFEGSSESSNEKERPSDLSVTSFPGDILLYTNCDLFNASPVTNALQHHESENNCSGQDVMQFANQQTSVGNHRNISTYGTYDSSQRQQACPKETKMRSKWTVTENLTSTADTSQSIANVFSGLGETSGQAANRFRTRGTSSTALKLDSSTRSLNAEFFHLRSKVLENTQDSSGQWSVKDKQQEILEGKLPTPNDTEHVFRPESLTTGGTCITPYTQKYFPHVDTTYVNASPVSLESIYFASAANIPPNQGHNYGVYYPPHSMIDYSIKYLKNVEQSYENRTVNVDPAYIGKAPTKQLELAPVPRNRMTLLSQIEPCTSDKTSDEMTANLSAWFASMRNSEGVEQIPISNVTDPRVTDTTALHLPPRQELSKNAIELAKQLQMDTNRQIQALQNIQGIQNAPWNVLHLINSGSQVQHIQEDYDSSEDVRVYMKPGSYNVPKKKYQRRSNRRMDNNSLMSRNQSTNNHRGHYTNKEKVFYTPISSTPVSHVSSSISVNNNNNTSSTTTIKLPFPATPIVPPPAFSLENSPRILKRNETISAPQSAQDVTWKAACASAEILLDALTVKENSNVDNKSGADRSDDEDEDDENGESLPDKVAKDEMKNSLEIEEKIQEKLPDCLKTNDDCDDATSYEASEDDSESPYRLSPNTSAVDTSQSPDNRNGLGKINVKTDSWLIRTLNSASVISKQKRRHRSKEKCSSESTNSSTAEDDQVISSRSPGSIDPTGKVINATAESFQQSKCSRDIRLLSFKDDRSLTEETDPLVGKATYSETLRRSMPMGTYTEKKDSYKGSKLTSTIPSNTCSTIIPIPGRKYQRKDSERSFHLLQKSRRSLAKKYVKSSEMIVCQSEEGSSTKLRVSRSETIKGTSSIASCVIPKSVIAARSHGRKRDGSYSEYLDGKCSGKSSDRGWSVWYSSKKKQTLSPLALSKLELIHQTIWKMEDADIFKQPLGNPDIDEQSPPRVGSEDYCKVIKNPVFLETVAYKLKNRIYHKVEQAIRDFRRIIYNSKLYHKHNQERVKVIDTLSKKLEDLFEEHFASWEFNNITGSPREGSPISHQFKSSEQKLATARYGNARKSPSTSVVTENASCH